MTRSLPAALVVFAALAGPAFGQGFSPDEALKRMQVPDGFAPKLVACEPMIRQPLSLSFDQRGRLWVLQYLQYPNPNGLKPVKQDQYLRTVWDRVPEPPPKGPKGADRITILSDPDENGRFRKSKDFVTGLNLATGFCIGHGGVFVVQPPYLLFYPDKDGDDVPDGDPEVLLAGFGMEDSHSYANSLQWGPDGWLYGAHGSTVSAKIKNPAEPNAPPLEFQQGIWRYHPKTRRLELFAEGGGNTYGLDFDKHGQAIAGTNWGGKAMLHQVQGGYYVKGFAKHGPLHNPHTYGYFDHVPYPDFKGGHVTCGGIVYQADAYPEAFRDQYIAGNLLSNALYWHKMTPQGSSFTARHGGDFLVSNDTWFRPVDCFLGPDGSVYVADWYDKRAAHLDPVDNWDKTNGRVYKVEYKGTKQPAPFDLGKKTSLELVELLKHPNKWWRNEARRLLADRRNTSVIPVLRKLVLEEKGLLALEALWALYVSGGFDEGFADRCFTHPNEHVRAWTVRLIGDDRKATTPQRERMVSLAKNDPSPIVRCQLACTAKRLPAADCLPIVRELMLRTEDVKDPFIPLLVWWALEDKAIAARPDVLRLFADPQVWKAPLVREVLLERVARRYLSEGTDADFAACAKLLGSAPSPAEVAILVRGMEKALEGRRLDKVPGPLAGPLADLRAKNPNDETIRRFAVRLGDESAYRAVLARAGDAKRPDAERQRSVDLLGQARRPDALPTLLAAFREGKSDALRLTALNALQGYSEPSVSEAVLAAYPKLSGNLRQRARAFLLSRPASALALLQMVDQGKLQPKEFPLEQLRPAQQLGDARITKIIEKHWGKIGAATPGEKQARISWLNIALSRGTGDAAKGKALFTKHCAACHTLFGEGGKVGPDLTGADRKNRGSMLANIVDPSAYIRPEFVSFNVVTNDGRRLSGLVGESSAESVTLLNVVNDQPQRTVVSRADIDDMKPSATSLMPEKVLDTLSDQEVRDLFAYLQADGPKQPAKEAPKQPASGKAAPAKDGKKLKVLLISGSLEYKSDESLAAFQKYLEANYPVECLRAFRKTDDDLPGLEQLDSCDVALFFTRRLTIKGEQLERVKKYAESGKPIVGLRTASHGFQNWLAMDKEVFGGDYKGHFGAGPKCEVKIVESAKNHPVLKGVKPFVSNGSLYKNPMPAKDVTVLLTGSIPEHTEPIAWVRQHKGGRVFYTSLGHPDDFKDPNFLRLVVNALFWTTGRDVPGK